MTAVPALHRVFLSAASAEFGALRDKLAALLHRSGIEVEHQDIFAQSATDTLRKIAGLIEAAPIVVHIVGHTTGSVAHEAAVDDLFRLIPKDRLLVDHPPLRRELGDTWSGLTYTQWEAFLALHFGVPLLVYATASTVDPATRTVRAAAPQKEHYQRLVAARRHPELCATEADFVGAILADVYRHFGVVPPALAPQNLPYPTLGGLFKGREAFLAQIGAQVAQQQATVIRGRQAIHGMGGVGKTRAAVEFAWAHAGDYSALLFVTADAPEALERNLAALAEPLVLNLPEHTEREIATQIAGVLRWLHQHPGWLLIVDNVDSDEAQDAVATLLRRIPDGHVIVTSRLADWPAGVSTLDLDVLSEASSVAFLLERTEDRRSRRVDDAAVAGTIARLVDGLALALEQCAAYVRHRRCSLADYVADFERKRASVLAWHDPAKSHYPVGIAVTYDTSVAQLSADAALLLRVLSWLAPEPIPLWAVEKLQAIPDPRSALIELADLHLARLNDEGTACTVHRLLQDMTRRQQQADVVPPALMTALAWIDAEYPFDADDVRSWLVATPLAPHAIATAGFGEDRENGQLSSRLFNQLGLYFKAKANFALAENFARRALALNERTLGASHAVTVANLSNLASLLAVTNRVTEAEQLNREALTIAEGLQPPADATVAICLNNLGHLLFDIGRFDEAEPLLRRALAIDSARLPQADPTLATRLDNLAKVLYRTGRLDEAEPLMERAVTITVATFGDSHPAVAKSLNNLAQLLKARGRLTDAEAAMRRVLAIDEAAFGDTHPELAPDLANLGRLLCATGRPAEAEPLLRRALAIEEAAFGAAHPEVGLSLMNLGQLLHDTGRSRDAEPLFKRALLILLAASRDSGRRHQGLEASLAYYVTLLIATGMAQPDAIAAVRALMAEHGFASIP